MGVLGGYVGGGCRGGTGHPSNYFYSGDMADPLNRENGREAIRITGLVCTFVAV